VKAHGLIAQPSCLFQFELNLMDLMGLF